MAILIGIRPEWVAKILNGEKTIEIRKTMPKCKLPCKVYIYCTKASKKYRTLWKAWDYFYCDDRSHNLFDKIINGKVVAEFTLEKVEKVEFPFPHRYWETVRKILPILNEAQIPFISFLTYANESPTYAWHISNLKIYDKPKELKEFKKQNSCFVAGDYDNLGCWESGCVFYETGDCDGRCSKITRPPQSWCYCEELEEK